MLGVVCATAGARIRPWWPQCCGCQRFGSPARWQIPGTRRSRTASPQATGTTCIVRSGRTPGGERGERRAWRCELAATHDHDLIVTFTAARMLYCGYTPVVEQRLKWVGGVVQPDLNTLGGGMVASSPSSQLLCSATPASRKMGGQGSRCTAAACAPAPGSGPPRTLHVPRTLRAASEAADGTLPRIDFTAAISS